MQWNKNRTYLALVLIIGAVALWYSGKAAWAYYDYASTSVSTAPEEISWIVEAESDEVFRVVGIYTFVVKGQTYGGETLFSSRKYRNKWAAEEGIEKNGQTQWRVWYSPRDPTHSTLERKFPTKLSLSALVLWGIVLYFMWLGVYVIKQTGD